MIWLVFILGWGLYFWLSRNSQIKQPTYSYVDEIDVGYGGIHKHTRRIKND